MQYKIGKMVFVVTILLLVPLSLVAQTWEWQQTPICLDRNIYYIPKSIFREYINNNDYSALRDYWNRQGLNNAIFDYFCWNRDSNKVLIPTNFDQFSILRAQQFERMTTEWINSQLNYVLLTAGEMMLLKLSMIKEKYSTYAYEIDNVLQDGHYPSLVRFYIFKSIRPQYLEFAYCLFTRSEWHRATRCIDSTKVAFIRNRLNLVKNSQNNSPINIKIQGYLGQENINSICHEIIFEDFDNRYEIPFIYTGGCISLNPFINLNDIEKLRCNRINIRLSTAEKTLMHTSVYEDLLCSSTIERNWSDTTFVLTYCKTDTFARGDSIGTHLLGQLNRMAEFVKNYYNNFNQNEKRLHIEFIGYADMIGLEELRELQWLSVNRVLALARGNWIRSQFFKNLYSLHIPISSDTVRVCNDLYYHEHDRSVEIKVWIRESGDLF